MKVSYRQFLFQLGLVGMKLGLENSYKLLNLVGNPHKRKGIIHIAGTNGKGSTLIILERLLINSGFKVGSTTSPHLIRFNERFRFQGHPISDKELEDCFLEICHACGINPDQPENRISWKILPTFFEFSIALAFLWFHKKDVDYLLLETGLGGKLDATNVVSHPLACILSPIGKDHEEFLGAEIQNITDEKLGILKKHSFIFVSHQEKQVAAHIREHTKKNQLAIRSFGIDFKLNVKEKIYSSDKNTIELKGLSLKGNHQLQNAATALDCYLHVLPQKNQLGPREIASSIQNVKWPGRLEYISKEPNILIDGAHNSHAFNVLAKHLLENHGKDRILMAITWMKGKNLIQSLDLLQPLHLVFQPINFDFKRVVESEVLMEVLKSTNISVKPLQNVEIFRKSLKATLTLNYDLVVVTGSLYFLGAFLTEWNSK